jgi:hypothetical protein
MTATHLQELARNTLTNPADRLELTANSDGTSSVWLVTEIGSWELCAATPDRLTAELFAWADRHRTFAAR